MSWLAKTTRITATKTDHSTFLSSWTRAAAVQQVSSAIYNRFSQDWKWVFLLLCINLEKS